MLNKDCNKLASELSHLGKKPKTEKKTTVKKATTKKTTSEEKEA